MQKSKKTVCRQPKRNVLLSFLAFFGGTHMLCAEVVEFQTESVRSIEVKSYQGSVNLKAQPQATTVKLKTSGTSQVFTRITNGVLIVEVAGPQDKTAWLELMKRDQLPGADLEISGPSLPADVFMRRGKINLINWSAAANVNMVNGQVKADSGLGDLRVDLHSGGLQVRHQQGAMNLASFDATVEVQESSGDLKVENYVGTTRLNNEVGKTALFAHRGTVHVERGSGEIEMANDRALIRIDEFEGGLRGRTGVGSVLAKLKGEIDVQLRSEDGDVRLRVPESGADVNVATTHGQLLVPEFLQTYRSESVKSAKGKLRGAVPGRIHVRSQNGAVQVN